MLEEEALPEINSCTPAHSSAHLGSDYDKRMEGGRERERGGFTDAAYLSPLGVLALSDSYRHRPVAADAGEEQSSGVSFAAGMAAVAHAASEPEMGQVHRRGAGLSVAVEVQAGDGFMGAAPAAAPPGHTDSLGESTWAVAPLSPHLANSLDVISRKAAGKTQAPSLAKAHAALSSSSSSSSSCSSQADKRKARHAKPPKTPRGSRVIDLPDPSSNPKPAAATCRETLMQEGDTEAGRCVEQDVAAWAEETTTPGRVGGGPASAGVPAGSAGSSSPPSVLVWYECERWRGRERESGIRKGRGIVRVPFDRLSNAPTDLCAPVPCS